MTIRIKTTTIPAQAIETAVIFIPAAEWNNMRLKKAAMTNIMPIIFFIFCFSIVIFGALYVPGIVEQYAIDVSSDRWVYTILGVSLATGIPIATLMTILPSKATSLEQNLLKKHGWDGEMDYEVELELRINPRPKELETRA